ncbi:MAG: single-stranded DNA-binding protein [Pseudoalteromonas spongiae]
MINKEQPVNQLCSVTLLGNLVATPEIRYLANPLLAVTEFTLATTHRWQDKRTKAQKEWTSYHTIKVVGHLVEQVLTQVKKGDIALVQGYLANHKHDNDSVIHATHLETFAKGFTHNINQLQCSATINSDINLVTTASNIPLANFSVCIRHQAYSELKQTMLNHEITRDVHVWGKQAEQIHEQAAKGKAIILEGRLSYTNDSQKKQLIEANYLHLLKLR